MVGPGAGGLGKGQPDIPSGLHVAVHSRGQPRAAAMVQRPLPQDDLRRDRRQSVRGARRHGYLGVTRRGAHADARPARARRRGGAHRGRASPREPVFREPSSSSSTRAITSCSSTSRRGSGSGRPCSHFCSPGEPAGDSAFAALSARERQVLALMADGLSNADIAERLSISEKTVRNHASNLFDKLGVWSRAQAIVFARDHGFSG